MLTLRPRRPASGRASRRIKRRGVPRGRVAELSVLTWGDDRKIVEMAGDRRGKRLKPPAPSQVLRVVRRGIRPEGRCRHLVRAHTRWRERTSAQVAAAGLAAGPLPVLSSWRPDRLPGPSAFSLATPGGGLAPMGSRQQTVYEFSVEPAPGLPRAGCNSVTVLSTSYYALNTTLACASSCSLTQARSRPGGP